MGTKAFLKAWKSGLFVNFDFIAPGSGSGSVFPIREPGEPNQCGSKSKTLGYFVQEC